MAARSRSRSRSQTGGEMLAAAAVQVAVKVLQSEAVQEQIKRASAALIEWASERRAQLHGGRLRRAMGRLNPADRLGQRGLERRIKLVADGITLAFGERSSTSRAELWTALDELEKSIAVAGGLPIVKRKRLHMRIDNQLDELEGGLIDAVLPKS